MLANVPRLNTCQCPGERKWRSQGQSRSRKSGYDGGRTTRNAQDGRFPSQLPTCGQPVRVDSGASPEVVTDEQ